MKITFLGTSHGVPAKERYCQSMLVENGENAYLIDAGAPVIDLLLRMNFDLKRLKAIFITHMHGDHISGLQAIMDLASWYFKDMDFDVYLTEKERTECLEALLDSYPNERVRRHLITGGGPVYEKDGMKVTAFPTTHMEARNRPAYGFLLETADQKLYISGDLNGEKIDYPDFINEDPVDLFVVECAHFAAEALCEKLQCCAAKTTAVIHTFPLDKYDVLKAAGGSLPCKLLLPEDGDIVEIGE
ncbi:MAG: MBL fold metallo-hydrolase [Lachnospiraceae bacterium]|nr:MBL fold metallo-hydrolase [Lachnospiraceae bacterium]